MNWRIFDEICNWASHEGYRRVPVGPQSFGDRFSAWVYELGRREGEWLRTHEKRVS